MTMGADSRIIGFGPFKKEFIGMDLLPYPDNYYNDVKEGTIIIVEFCGCNTTAQSENLAYACGADLHDFNTHYLERGKGIQIYELHNMVEFAGIAEWTDQDVRNLDYLVNTRLFRFFLQPNM
jgi:hypothetical protein